MVIPTTAAIVASILSFFCGVLITLAVFYYKRRQLISRFMPGGQGNDLDLEQIAEVIGKDKQKE